MTSTHPILPAEQIRAGHAPLLSLPVLRPPADLFARRAARLRQLADGHAMADFLRLCATLCDRQQTLLDAAAAPSLAPEWLATLLRQLAEGLSGQLPAPAQTALDQLTSLPPAALQTVASALSEGAINDDAPLAALPLLGAALQVQYTAYHRARPLPQPDHQTERCPCCGGLPLASVLTRGDSGHAQRHALCALCGHAWPVGRVRCLGCGNSRDLRYYSLAPQDYEPPEPDHQRPHQTRGAQEVEACGECHGALKQVSLLQDPDAEAGADDLASLALDLLAGEAGYARLGFNPLFLPGT
ncbi:formate dehydrogenase accessory protein FdhE [Chromobacterium sp. ASV23]|uniref:formate dehydrogenase accessory protein FdhE domain-containing protein n=1 Tax=Chromobacterium sp. ASV23 TaxID=2795110 RepID=UPI0018EA86BA|nr:formate dehydrogenase accessory protein FdhE [Chromobacterium sp. ASV23]